MLPRLHQSSVAKPPPSQLTGPRTVMSFHAAISDWLPALSCETPPRKSRAPLPPICGTARLVVSRTRRNVTDLRNTSLRGITKEGPEHCDPKGHRVDVDAVGEHVFKLERAVVWDVTGPEHRVLVPAASKPGHREARQANAVHVRRRAHRERAHPRRRRGDCPLCRPLRAHRPGRTRPHHRHAAPPTPTAIRTPARRRPHGRHRSRARALTNPPAFQAKPRRTLLWPSPRYKVLVTTHLPFTFFNATFPPTLIVMAWATEAVTCSPVVRVTFTPES